MSAEGGRSFVLGPAAALLAVALFVLLRAAARALLRRHIVPARRPRPPRVRPSDAAQGSVAFFHPFTNDGGGGERVLWCAVRAVQACSPHAQVYIYTGDETPAEQLAQRAEALFGVPVLRPVRCVRLRCRGAVRAEAYPVLTLLGQAAGSVLLGAEALARLTPQLWVDTAGYAFAYPLAAFAGCRVVAYVHYPFVSSDMLAAVGSRTAAFNNRARVARSRLLSALKLRYYAALARAYGAVGRASHLALCNSSWTAGHIRALWGPGHADVRVLYPPCNTRALSRLPLRRPPGPLLVLSVAQFRPEKAHPLQLRAWASLLARGRAQGFRGPWAALRGAQLLLVGGVRGEGDAARLAALQAQADALFGPGAGAGADGLGWAAVGFAVGIPSSALVGLLARAQVGLHTMRDEHFGISVVEYMAAGCVPLAHASAGPQLDIVLRAAPGRPLPGRLAESEEEYAEALEARPPPARYSSLASDSVPAPHGRSCW